MEKNHVTVAALSSGNSSAERIDKEPQVKIEPIPRTRTDELARPRRAPKPLLFDRIYRACAEQAIGVKAIIIAVITCIPFVIFYCVSHQEHYKNVKIGPPKYRVNIRFLSTWLIVCWGSFIGILYIGRVLAAGLCYLCSQSTAMSRYRRLASEVMVRLTLMLWAAVGYASIVDIAKTQQSGISATALDSWVKRLHTAFMFLIIAFAVIFVQGVLLQLISIQYIEGYIGPRTERASNELETIKALQDLVNPHLDHGNIGFLAKMLRKVFMPVNSRDAYYLISRGQGNDEVWQEYAFKIWSEISAGRSYITVQDITQRLIAMNREPEKGQDLFYALDESTDGQVTEDEVHKLIRQTGVQLNKRAQAMCGIKALIRKLEIITSIVMLGIIVFIYGKSHPSTYQVRC